MIPGKKFFKAIVINMHDNDDQKVNSGSDSANGANNAGGTQDLDNRLKDLEQKLSEMENNWKRALADYKNLEKRIVEERMEFIGYSNSLLISKLLSVLDNLENLEKHNGDMGLKLTLKELRQILSEEGLTEIDTAGKYFDSNVMEAIETVDGEDGKVAEMVLKGYMLKNKLLRPAKVKVGLKKKEEN
ncbi:nucleotide exchange factor GrpE [candidate division WWE3 bacterium RIFCSPHIGHO2_12_FULL_38_15]|uniref:Protein GrpE n=1 Tax=candidate division WWE3 bacterium RIFCSPHIGHO2_02_FULL_38_14 TaxID=1802620 RepID=A0A1F4VBQ2_UNCKA|nr:MAG: nucleotide exchange factor GrpE [candidate division WWE3 bacterium RIFCSPHIGHO2_01_FULL_38_45]OGC49258.1 MAG: nucleotide exchange factor GrpE [candidate division WWE3 bacterium RIFCSPHIGHO2_12_FULL_38_15]OGC54002.1 MAG: nucleotide exchange factor GrpE [candidate division WWE3 bacterium RIFCSPLOWO2_01_FULL_37_24]OGC54547.1 MAG: nucleotide exchange factor GrpE [candidate division WWE3 bacterium RIFCSPHIGHO2_02_FULL_38_14]